MENEKHQELIENSTKVILFCESLISYNKKILEEFNCFKQLGTDLEYQLNDLKKSFFGSSSINLENSPENPSGPNQILNKDMIGDESSHILSSSTPDLSPQTSEITESGHENVDCSIERDEPFYGVVKYFAKSTEIKKEPNITTISYQDNISNKASSVCSVQSIAEEPKNKKVTLIVNSILS